MLLTTYKIRLVCVFFFFFKQKTAYEIRKGDWSSDVCSSDLSFRFWEWVIAEIRRDYPDAIFLAEARSEERRVGKDVLPCVDLGGRRIIKKKTKNRENESKGGDRAGERWKGKEDA